MIRSRFLFPALLFAAPVFVSALASGAAAQFAPTAEERLRALTAPPQVDIYGEEKNADRASIAAEADWLFGDGAAIVLFTGPDCPDCPAAEETVRFLTKDMGLTAKVIPLDDESRPVFERLGFDVVPSYVLPQMLIRGAMPAIVLRSYLLR